MSDFDVQFSGEQNLDVEFDSGETFNVEFGGARVVDYNDEVYHKPSINGVELVGNVSLEELGIGSSVFFAEYDVNTYQEIDDAYHDGNYVVAFIEDSASTIGFFELFKYDPNEATYTFKRRSGAVTYTLMIDDNDTWSASFGTMDTGDLSNRAGFIKSPNVVYCTCATSKGTAAKVATIVSGTLTGLHAGDQAIVKFTNSNTSASPTLKIGDTDAKSIMRYGTTVPSASAETSWNAGSPILFVYDGTYWQMCGYLNSVYYEISEANITNATGSTAGLVTGRRVKKAVETFAPVKDVEVDGESVVVDGVAKITIPPLVTDLGEIDGDQYDWDIEEYLNTLQESGSYIFLWDEFKYWVDIEALEVDGVTTVEQVYWGTEEGSSSTYYRNLLIEDGEVIDSYVTQYMTSDVASNLFAPKNHQHYRTDGKSLSIWDYCDGNQINMQNGSPILYTDTLNGKHYLIETWQAIRQPTYIIQKVTDLIDCSVFYQAGRTNWGNWYKFTGTVFTP